MTPSPADLRAGRPLDFHSTLVDPIPAAEESPIDAISGT